MTLLLDIAPEAQLYFDHLRQEFFPKHQLRDTAHLTLLYQIHERPEKTIEKLQSINSQPFQISATGLLPYTTGNAIRMESEQLQALHRTLKQTFKGRISRRDLVRYRPHITVQLHVTAFKAQRTLEALHQSCKPFSFSAQGMSLWLKDKKQAEQLWQQSFAPLP